MRLNVTALAMTLGLIWGAAVFLVAAANLIWPGYGTVFLDLVSSIYPGYHPSSGIGSVITGTLYALLDGAVCGAVVAWLYNRLAQRGSAGSA
jgi:hypothetical protein